MRSIETCRECGRHNGAHSLGCQAFGRQANAVMHRTTRSTKASSKRTRKEGTSAR